VDYYEPDSWLVDYASRVRLWREIADEVTIVDYDDVTKRDGSVLPSFAKLVGIPVRLEYFLNTSDELSQALAAAMRQAGAT